jgi:hypothetical protein
MHGQGEYVWKNGDRYTGEFQNDKKHGQGELIYADYREKKGIWENGEFLLTLPPLVSSTNPPANEPTNNLNPIQPTAEINTNNEIPDMLMESYFVEEKSDPRKPKTQPTSFDLIQPTAEINTNNEIPDMVMESYFVEEKSDPMQPPKNMQNNLHRLLYSNPIKVYDSLVANTREEEKVARTSEVQNGTRKTLKQSRLKTEDIFLG